MLLLWGVPLKEFYQRMANGDIPNAEELFSRLKKHDTARLSIYGAEGLGVMIRDRASDRLKATGKRTNQLIRIDASQPMPLLDAVREDIHLEGLMKAQQGHIRKIDLASSNVESPANPTGGSPHRQKHRQEPDALSYIDAFSRLAQTESPKLVFPFKDVSLKCSGITSMLFNDVLAGKVTVPQAVLECPVMRPFLTDDPSARKALLQVGNFGHGTQSVCSLVSLVTMFGDRAGSWTNLRLERHMLGLLEKQRKTGSGYSGGWVTKRFVEKCKEFGFSVPECTIGPSTSCKTGQSA